MSCAYDGLRGCHFQVRSRHAPPPLPFSLASSARLPGPLPLDTGNVCSQSGPSRKPQATGTSRGVSIVSLELIHVMPSCTSTCTPFAPGSFASSTARKGSVSSTRKLAESIATMEKNLSFGHFQVRQPVEATEVCLLLTSCARVLAGKVGVTSLFSNLGGWG